VELSVRPLQILPKAMADSSMLAEVVTDKFVDGLPLYRQEKIFAREGIDLSRQTMSGWIVQLATPLTPDGPTPRSPTCGSTVADRRENR